MDLDAIEALGEQEETPFWKEPGVWVSILVILCIIGYVIFLIR